MSIFRQYVVPALIVVVFLVAMVAVSARAFLPSDMAAPAPIEDSESLSWATSSKGLLSEVRSPRLHLGQFCVGQFYIGQFYIGQFYID